VRAKPLAHVRIFFKDLAHLLGLVAADGNTATRQISLSRSNK
jgi:hypothetical protein